MTSINEKKAHFVLIPLVAQGHLIPMTDLAHLLAERGVHVSFITTPINAARIQPIVQRSIESNLPIQFVELKLPCAQIGLPDECENVDLIDSSHFMAFFEVLEQLRDPLEQYLRTHHIPPSCIISDGCNPWTVEIARRLCAPRIVFHGPSCLFALCDHKTSKHKILHNVTDYSEQFAVPDMPITLRFTKETGPGFFNAPGLEKIRDDTVEAERTADAIILNTFEDLERQFIELYEKELGKKVWTVGPLNLYNKDENSKSLRGNKLGAERQQIVLNWLDSHKPKSVLYVSFGSLARKSSLQLMELGFSLEATEKPFLWVIKEAEITPEIDRWLSKEFEKRVDQQKGLIFRGWAPQLAILSHHSIGAFMTHCGWNSMLESISLGVPMVTWPHFSDQFTNEKLVVDVMGLGVSLGVSVSTWMPAGDDTTILVNRDDIKRAISKLMGEEEVAKEIRRKAADMAEKAKKAMEEGGSSHNNITRLIESIILRSNNIVSRKEG